MNSASDMDELSAWLVLLRAPGMGRASLHDLLATHDWDIRVALERARHCDRLGAATLAWLRRPDPVRLAADRDWLAEPGHTLLCCNEVDFPPWLAHIDRPPAALFIEGQADWLLRPQVAIVGARAADGAARAVAARFARALGQAGFVVTSGLADGIDGAAHTAALEAGLPTVAVVGTGLDLVYPRKHAGLARRVAAHGALVSEFPLGTPARAAHFPQRNRILSGLSLGTLVVEADLRSGSLITARLAAEQGREVFAVPGSIHNPRARGCNKLIRDGARLVEDPDEIVQILTPAARALGLELSQRLHQDAATAPTSAAADRAPDDPARARLLAALGHAPAGMDDLIDRTGCGVGELTSMLLLLELEGVVESLAGNRYQRLPA